jgi:hypothetical protein
VARIAPLVVAPGGRLWYSAPKLPPLMEIVRLVRCMCDPVVRCQVGAWRR